MDGDHGRERAIHEFLLLLHENHHEHGALGREVHRKKITLSLAGVTDAEILNLIHDIPARMRAVETERLRKKAQATQIITARRNEVPDTNIPGCAPAPSPRTQSISSRDAGRQPSDGSAAPITLTTPFALASDGRLVAACTAEKHGTYTCPGCGGALLLRQGNIRIPHFAHTPAAVCRAETALHATAKLLAAQVLRAHAEGDTHALRILRACSWCAKEFDWELPRLGNFLASVEHSVARFVCDVVGLRQEMPVLGVELRVTHAVDEQKAAELPIPWVELDAAALLDDPWHWKPLRSGRFKDAHCPQCHADEELLQAATARWRIPYYPRPRGRQSTPSPYLAVSAPCWNCEETIVWYWWPGTHFSEAKPPEPVPRTIKYKFQKEFRGSYWVNCCPRCGRAQGDNFVFLDERSPLYGLPGRKLPGEMQRQVARRVIRRFFGRR